MEESQTPGSIALCPTRTPQYYSSQTPDCHPGHVRSAQCKLREGSQFARGNGSRDLQIARSLAQPKGCGYRLSVIQDDRLITLTRSFSSRRQILSPSSLSAPRGAP